MPAFTSLAAICGVALTILVSQDAQRTGLLAAGQTYHPQKVGVIDGDTLKIDDINVRIANLDTPERGGRAECDAERFLAAVATTYAEELVKGDLMVIPEGREDYYKRPLVRVSVDGKDWGQLMVEANMAVPWTGRTHNWCASR